MTSERGLGLLGSPIGLELLYLIDQRHETSLTDEELVSRALEARGSATIYRGDYAEHVHFLRSRAHSYEALAEEVGQRMSNWWEPLDRAAQIWAHRDPRPPAAADLVPDLSQLSLEVPKPKTGLWTSTYLRGLVSPWLDFPENLHRSHPQHTWRLVVAAGARVAEIHSPQDWWSLARAYAAKTKGFRFALKPMPSHPNVLTHGRSDAFARVDPDWEALAQDWDAVHVSMAGVMTAEDVTFERDGVVTELRGWDVESTVWLRWVFNSVEEIDVHGRVPDAGP